MWILIAHLHTAKSRKIGKKKGGRIDDAKHREGAGEETVRNGTREMVGEAKRHRKNKYIAIVVSKPLLNKTSALLLSPFQV